MGGLPGGSPPDQGADSTGLDPGQRQLDREPLSKGSAGHWACLRHSVKSRCDPKTQNTSQQTPAHRRRASRLSTPLAACASDTAPGLPASGAERGGRPHPRSTLKSLPQKGPSAMLPEVTSITVLAGLRSSHRAWSQDSGFRGRARKNSTRPWAQFPALPLASGDGGLPGSKGVTPGERGAPPLSRTRGHQT